MGKCLNENEERAIFDLCRVTGKSLEICSEALLDDYRADLTHQVGRCIQIPIQFDISILQDSCNHWGLADRLAVIAGNSLPCRAKLERILFGGREQGIVTRTKYFYMYLLFWVANKYEQIIRRSAHAPQLRKSYISQDGNRYVEG